MVARLFGATLLVLLGGCLAAPPQPLRLNSTEIHQDSVWQGEVVIDGAVRVSKGASLTILPGTEVRFVPRDADRDGLGDATLIVEGRLQAVGTPEAPIRFRSAADQPRPGDWLELRVDFSREVLLRYCEIRDSAHTLHAHFTRGEVADCHIHHNIDGSRLGQTQMTIRNCLIEHNSGKGINFRNSSVAIHHNIIRHNGAGIFLFETDRPARIEHNNLYANDFNLRLGDFFQQDLAVQNNWWGSPDPEAAGRTLYDSRRDAAIGTIHIAPAPHWLEGTGPRLKAQFTSAWQQGADGYVDAPLVGDAQAVYAADWGGTLRALRSDGTLLWQRALGEVVDASPALDATGLYLQSWRRQVLALERADGRERWRWEYPASRADDHRQGGLLRVGELLLVPAWNGQLYALDAASGALRWQLSVGQPLRAAPRLDGDRLYQASGAGVLVALDLAGNELWRWLAAAPLLTPPALLPEGPVVLDRDGRLTALDRQGRPRWQQHLAETCYYAAPIAADGALFVATAGGALWKFAADGRRLWRRELAGPAYATPLHAGTWLAVGDNSGTLQLIHADSGALLGHHSVAGAIQAPPLQLGRRLLFGSRAGAIHALDLNLLPVDDAP